AFAAAALAIAAVLPFVLSVDRSLKGSALLIYAVLGLSLVLLSGWGGAVSLGHVAFFAIGAAVVGWTSTEQGADLVGGLAVATVVGALVAVVIGVPASRLRGLPLAITTFAFSLATTSYLLNDEFFDWVPTERIPRRPLLGGFDVSTPTEVFLLALAVLVLVAIGARGIRDSRTGRAAVALRDNDRAGEAFGIPGFRVRLATYALSGGIAALAGGLFAHHQQAFDPSSFAPIQNLAVFTMVVIGGLTSVTGAFLGALFLLGTQWFLPQDWRILASGIGVLAVLWLVPGGLATVPFALRDRALRAVARRRGIDLEAWADDGREEQGPPPAAAPIPPPATDGAAPVLAVEHLEVSYGPVQVLFGVDLAVAEGEAVALLGTNGAGKSTLLRSVAGLLPPGGGTVVLDGEDITGRAAHRVAALGLAEVPGGAGIFPSLTVAENLRAAGWLHRRRPDELAAGRAEVDRLFPVLGERGSTRAGSLSGGQQQMLALAMACLGRPRVLLIDELSLGLAPVVVARLLRLVEELRARGTTVVLVDQSVNVALEVADRAVFLERGVVRFSGPAGELLDRPDLLRSVFLGGAGDGGAARVADLPPPPEAGDGAPVLEAEGLCVAFDGVAAVQDVSLAVRPGEIVGILGPNGAGKTTLFDLLSGFLPPGAGRVRLDGRDVTSASPSSRARAGLGRSFQDARLFPSLTVTETIAAACERWVQVKDPLSAAFHLPTAYDSERAVSRRVDELLDLL
ncbi:MAG TPA: ATP-binding cassette domain-containing protein, partial [Acidimicrobiales bacterium]|nr:ATP-binding cassette domain-containing protein [Acidimicrobiales bacterium]